MMQVGRGEHIPGRKSKGGFPTRISDKSEQRCKVKGKVKGTETVHAGACQPQP